MMFCDCHKSRTLTALPIVMLSGVTLQSNAATITPAFFAEISASPNAGCILMFGVKYSTSLICTIT